MAEQAQIPFAASAIKDLEDMQAYYLGEGVPDVGKRLTAEIVAKSKRQGGHPLRGRVVPEFSTKPLELPPHARKSGPRIAPAGREDSRRYLD